jgi:nucleotide-binding universal stress UspA family protein
MYKKILAGLDGSKHGIEATRAAVDLAKTFDAELHLLTITRPYKVSPKLRQFLEAENLLGEPKYVMDDMTNSIVSEAKCIASKAGLENVKAVVREGKPARALLDYAKANGIDLIVVGSRGVGELDAALLGSVSQKVSMLSACTVMIVR